MADTKSDPLEIIKAATNEEEGFISARLKVIFVTDYGPISVKLRANLEKEAHADVYDIDAANAPALARKLAPCLIITSVKNSDDVLKVVRIMVTLRDDITRKMAKVLAISPIDSHPLVEKFRSFGCADFIVEPIAERKLSFKIGLHTKALLAQRSQIRRHATNDKATYEAEQKRIEARKAAMEKASKDGQGSDQRVFKGDGKDGEDPAAANIEGAKNKEESPDEQSRDLSPGDQEAKAYGKSKSLSEPESEDEAPAYGVSDSLKSGANPKATKQSGTDDDSKEGEKKEGRDYKFKDPEAPDSKTKDYREAAPQEKEKKDFKFREAEGPESKTKDYREKSEEDENDDYEFQEKKRESKELSHEDKKEPEGDALVYTKKSGARRGSNAVTFAESKAPKKKDADYEEKKESSEANDLEYQEPKEDNKRKDLNFQEPKEKNKTKDLEFQEAKEPNKTKDLNFQEPKTGGDLKEKPSTEPIPIMKSTLARNPLAHAMLLSESLQKNKGNRKIVLSDFCINVARSISQVEVSVLRTAGTTATSIESTMRSGETLESFSAGTMSQAINQKHPVQDTESGAVYCPVMNLEKTEAMGIIVVKPAPNRAPDAGSLSTESEYLMMLSVCLRGALKKAA